MAVLYILTTRSPMRNPYTTSLDSTATRWCGWVGIRAIVALKRLLDWPDLLSLAR